MLNIISIDDVKRKHTGHWFDRDSMRFFRGRVASEAYLTDDKKFAFFVSSEQFQALYTKSEPRRYTVRVCNMMTGDIDTVGSFNEIPTSAQAKGKAQRLAEGKSPFYKQGWKDGKSIVYTSNQKDDDGFDIYSDSDIVFTHENSRDCDQWILANI